MVQTRKVIMDELILRLENDTTGLRATIDNWNIRNRKVWRGIGMRTYPPKVYPTVITEYDTARPARENEDVYKKVLPIGVEVWDKFKIDDILTVGEIILDRLQTAIELDQRFQITHNGNFISNLVKEYSLSGEDISEHNPGSGILRVSVAYEFTYYEDFRGKRGKI